jgi:putative iron-regulated protein
MSGERMAVAEETHDQEEEQSCFSDTTHLDFRANMRGIADVLRGDGAPGVIAVVATVDQARANAMTAALAAAVSAVDATPAPFDRAIRTAKGSPEHAQITAAIAALEKLGEEISAAAKLMGYSLPSEPHG